MRFKAGDKVRYIGPDIDNDFGKLKYGTTGVAAVVGERGLTIVRDDGGNRFGLTYNSRYGWDAKWLIKRYQWKKL